MLRFKIKIIWLKATLGIAVDQVYETRPIPLTGYYFWPRNDAWELIRLEIASKSWIGEEDKASILNQITQILNNWRENIENSKFEDLKGTFEELDLAGIQ